MKIYKIANIYDYDEENVQKIETFIHSIIEYQRNPSSESISPSIITRPFEQLPPELQQQFSWNPNENIYRGTMRENFDQNNDYIEDRQLASFSKSKDIVKGIVQSIYMGSSSNKEIQEQFDKRFIVITEKNINRYEYAIDLTKIIAFIKNSNNPSIKELAFHVFDDEDEVILTRCELQLREEDLPKCDCGSGIRANLIYLTSPESKSVEFLACKECIEKKVKELYANSPFEEITNEIIEKTNIDYNKKVNDIAESISPFYQLWDNLFHLMSEEEKSKIFKKAEELTKIKYQKLKEKYKDYLDAKNKGEIEYHDDGYRSRRTPNEYREIEKEYKKEYDKFNHGEIKTQFMNQLLLEEYNKRKQMQTAKNNWFNIYKIGNNIRSPYFF